ncbi:MAG: hypothetical protein JNM76_14725 [Betaproteobacteria bacterium]|nr:hypothetical protein [Betaproteobacteria bacterium]
MKPITALILAALPFTAIAQTGTKAQCDRLAKSADLQERYIAMEHVSGMGDDSAPRETNRRLRIQNALTAQQSNLFMMAQLKCPMPDLVSSSTGPDSKYYGEAVLCGIERQRGNASAEACKIQNWTGKADPSAK